MNDTSKVENDARPTVERIASEDADLCPVDDLPCWECPSYCLEEYPETPSTPPGTPDGGA